jgi:YYY domain-containing protein
VNNLGNIYKRVLWGLFAFIIVFIFDVKFMGMTDFAMVLVWWLVLLVLGLVFQPLAIILFKNFHDNGWMFSKTIGLSVSAWLVWYLSSMKLLKFKASGCYLVIALCFVINICIFKLYKKYSKNQIKLSEVYSVNKLTSMFNAEVIFFCFFALWCYLKGYNASAYGTEKFMDYGYLTAILKSEYMPAHDLWYSGGTINYYYLGQYISAYLIRISGVGAGYGYNLMMMTLAAMGFSLPYSIAYNLMKQNRIDLAKKGKQVSEKSKRTLPAVCGMLAGLSVSIAGNMHYPIYKWIMPKVQRILGKEVDDSYWFADATRYIGYNPDVDDKTIHEFPCYSFVLGDLHAHVINIIFVLTVLAILLAWLINRKGSTKISLEAQKPIDIHMVRELFSPWMCMCMFFIGLFHTTNYWDFPIYFVVCGAIILFSNLKTYRYKLRAWILTGLQAVCFVLVGIVVALPFTLSFDSISTSINFCDKHTAWYQLLVLWGLPTFITIMFLIVKIVECRKASKEKNLLVKEASNATGKKRSSNKKTLSADKELSEKTKRPNCIVRFMDSLSLSDLFVLTIGLCAIGLVILPEIIYVVDIYGGAYERANTMFKLVYQAFIMFAIVMAYVVVKHIKYYEGMIKKLAVFGLVLLCCTFCYFFEACDAWFSSYYSTLDASAFLETEDAADLAGINWINENVEDDAVVLEMCGLSYTFFNRISVFTGNSTVLGWQTHEWLWRSSGTKDYPEEMTERHNDIINIYTSSDVALVRSLIEKYGIDYIYVGGAEQVDGYASSSSEGISTSYHGGTYLSINVNDKLLKMLGEVTVISEAGEINDYETYIVKIDPDIVIEEETVEDEDTVNLDEVYKDATPLVKHVMDADGNQLSYSECTYNESGYLIEEAYYDADGVYTGCSEYSYDGYVISSGADYDADNNLVGFWNYIDFDNNYKCTMQHYFASDDSWVKTVNTNYDSFGCPTYAYIRYPDDSEVEYFYDVSDDSKIESITHAEGESTIVEQYIYDDYGNVGQIQTYTDGVLTGTVEYEY